jgi:hypothetical protein
MLLLDSKMSFIENYYTLQSNMQVLIDGYNLIAIYVFSISSWICWEAGRLACLEQRGLPTVAKNLVTQKWDSAGSNYETQVRSDTKGDRILAIKAL